MSNLAIKDETLLESVSLRNSLIRKDYVLDKVKGLSMLPDNLHTTTQMVAEYYDVESKTINSIIDRNREELESDGLKVLKGNDLKEFKQGFPQVEDTLKFASVVTLFPRRAILRVGMLLRDSDIAKQVRTYLLNAEEQLTPEQRQEAILELRIKDREQRLNAIQSVPPFLLDTIDKRYLSRVYENLVGEGIDKEPVIIELSTYLKDKRMPKDKKKYTGQFGKMVSEQYERINGHKPKKLHKVVNGKERPVNYYEEGDLPFLDEVFEQFKVKYNF